MGLEVGLTDRLGDTLEYYVGQSDTDSFVISGVVIVCVVSVGTFDCSGFIVVMMDVPIGDEDEDVVDVSRDMLVDGVFVPRTGSFRESKSTNAIAAAKVRAQMIAMEYFV